MQFCQMTSSLNFSGEGGGEGVCVVGGGGGGHNILP